MEERNIRIPINLNDPEKVINVKLDQEFDNLEILSLKITNSEAYTRHCSDFGVIVGRVVLNNGFGVQNAKVNIFIPITDEDAERSEITEIYPFNSIDTTYTNGVRYNLLPRIRNTKNSSHRAIGNFPDSSDFTNYPQYKEVMDKYYKFTTTTNESGDFMIFGVPTGQHDIIMDFDVFDTNSFEVTANDLVEQVSLNNSIDQILALLNANANTNEDITTTNRVPGFNYLGNNNYEVEVKTNLDEMPNIFHQVKKITVSPFWGDGDICDVGITRCDFKINFKYTPTAVFFGSLLSTGQEHYIDYLYNVNNFYPETSDNLYPEIYGRDSDLGYEHGTIYPLQKMEVVVYRLDDNLTPGSRKRLGVYTGSLYNGIFRITLPMYMDYYVLNESGDLIPTNDTNLGIPTKGYYCFEIYDTDDNFTNRRIPTTDGFSNKIIPGIRIPSTTTGDAFLGGWEGTWTGLFEYDLLNRKRKFYTIKTIYKKHLAQNILRSGDFVSFFPKFNQNKSQLSWNFPLSFNSVTNISDPSVIGSVIIPRFKIRSYEVNLGKSFAENDVEIQTAIKFLNEINIDLSETFNIKINDYEKYLGIGVKHGNGVNFGSVFTELFSDDDFIDNNTGESIFGEAPTWNYGDNSTATFIPSAYARSLSRKKGSNANAQSVHKAFNQVVNDQYTYGVFINSVIFTDKKPLMEILIHDITDELPNLIKDRVYSSYRKGNNAQQNISRSITRSINKTQDIFVETPISQSNSFLESLVDANNVLNSYKGEFYYFGLWDEANSLYDIEKNYFIK